MATRTDNGQWRAACCFVLLTVTVLPVLAAEDGAVPASVAAIPEVAIPAVAIPEVAIPFANHGGIHDWRVVDDATLLLQDVHGQWYLAKLFAPVYDLAYTDHLGFVTPPSGSLEKFGSVLIHGRRYPIVSLTRAPAPPARSKK